MNYGLESIESEYIRKGDFFYPKEYDKIIPRSPINGDDPRAIVHISDEEIGSALLKVASQSYGISKIALFQFTAKAFGFNRTGANITTAFERAFNELASDGRLTISDEKVYCKSST